MKIQTKKLNEALARLLPIAAGKTTLPILSAVRIEADGKNLKLAVTNLDEFAEETVECDGKIPATCVNLQQFAKSLGGDEVEISLGEDGHLSVSFSGGGVELSTQESDDFPMPPKLERPQRHGIACHCAAEAVSSVVWAAGDDLLRYTINSVRIESGSKVLSVVATDSRWLATRESATIGSEAAMSIPKAFCQRFAAALERDGALLSSSKNWVKVEHNNGYYFCKQIDGSYPNWRQVVPKERHLLGPVGITTMKEVALFCNAYNEKALDRSVRLFFSKDGLRLEFVGANNAKAHRVVGGEFDDFTVGVSLIRLKDIFSNLTGETAKIYRTGDNHSPLVIEAGEMCVVLMPMRLA